MARRVLLAWIGNEDLTAAQGQPMSTGALTQTLRAAASEFDEAVLLANQQESTVSAFTSSLKARTKVVVRPVSLVSPVDYAEIHREAVAAVLDVQSRHGSATRLSFLLNSGTAPMGSVWLLLGKGRFPESSELLAWSRGGRLEVVHVPFQISAEFAPRLIAPADMEVGRLSAEPALAGAAFGDIIHQCPEMKRLVRRAEVVALHKLPVLLEGETGTGKELLARAIHAASPRKDRAFVAVNCGAIPATLIESELFGHRKGAFTGADQARKGHFEAASGGTLFLDEIGELPLAMQVKLLRPLQEEQVVPLGSSAPIAVDVRVIAATHRSLLDDVVAGTFREDLYYRLAIATLRVPPLRERPGDVTLLIDALWRRVTDELAQSASSAGGKRLSPRAKARLLAHHWPGNVRELQNTLRRAALWSGGRDVDETAIQDALHQRVSTAAPILDRALSDGFDLREVMAQVARHYLERALRQSNGSLSLAARLLGLKSHQVLSQWLKRHSVDAGRALGTAARRRLG